MTTPDRVLIRCADCQWSVSRESLIPAVALAQQHAADTGHAIQWRWRA